MIFHRSIYIFSENITKKRKTSLIIFKKCRNKICFCSSADIDTWKINIILSLPRIEVKGKYEVIGQILLFPVRSKGDFWAAFGMYHIFI